MSPNYQSASQPLLYISPSWPPVLKQRTVQSVIRLPWVVSRTALSNNAGDVHLKTRRKSAKSYDTAQVEANFSMEKNYKGVRVEVRSIILIIFGARFKIELYGIILDPEIQKFLDGNLSIFISGTRFLC